MKAFETHRPATLDEVLAVLRRAGSTKVLVRASDLARALPAGTLHAAKLARLVRAPARGLRQEERPAPVTGRG